jgi:putative transposase
MRPLAARGRCPRQAGQAADVAQKAPAENIRNGGTPKTVSTDLGPVEIRTPRGRDSSFEPQLVRKRQRRIA